MDKNFGPPAPLIAQFDASGRLPRELDNSADKLHGADGRRHRTVQSARGRSKVLSINGQEFSGAISDSSWFPAVFTIPRITGRGVVNS